MARGGRAPHPSGGIGLQYLIWVVDDTDELNDLEQAVQARVAGRADTPAAGSPFSQAGILMASGSWSRIPAPTYFSRVLIDNCLYA